MRRSIWGGVSLAMSLKTSLLSRGERRPAGYQRLPANVLFLGRPVVQPRPRGVAGHICGNRIAETELDAHCVPEDIDEILRAEPNGVVVDESALRDDRICWGQEGPRRSIREVSHFSACNELQITERGLR